MEEDQLRGACQTKDAAYYAFYKVLEVSSGSAIIIVELAGMADQEATRELNNETEFSSELLAAFPSR